MPHLETVTAIEASGVRGEDRVAVFHAEDRTVIVVADGAGGVGSGDAAAETVVREVGAIYSEIHAASQWADLLSQIDCRISPGESTAVVIDCRPDGIAGASVGDSQAWIIRDGDITELTGKQNRKPLLGSGEAAPVPFSRPPLGGLLLAATDGFVNYAKRDAVKRMIMQSDFFAIARSCVEMVRLSSSSLCDDVAVVAARVKPRPRTRQRYSI